MQQNSEQPLEGMVNREFCQELKYSEMQTRAQIRMGDVGAHPDILLFTSCFIRRMKNAGVPMYPFEILRSIERQNEMYDTGKSQLRGNKGKHTYGEAVDIIHCTKYWDLTKEQWALVGSIGKEVANRLKIKIVWGGDWGWDMAHWELA